MILRQSAQTVKSGCFAFYSFVFRICFGRVASKHSEDGFRISPAVLAPVAAGASDFKRDSTPKKLVNFRYQIDFAGSYWQLPKRTKSARLRLPLLFYATVAWSASDRIYTPCITRTSSRPQSPYIFTCEAFTFFVAAITPTFWELNRFFSIRISVFSPSLNKLEKRFY
jgi:hypothetical protein